MQSDREKDMCVRLRACRHVGLKGTSRDSERGQEMEMVRVLDGENQREGHCKDSAEESEGSGRTEMHSGTKGKNTLTNLVNVVPHTAAHMAKIVQGPTEY